MKFVSWGDTANLAVRDNDGVLRDLSKSGRPATLQALIEAGPEALAKVRRLDLKSLPCLDASAKLTAPLPKPRRNIFCVGKNYREHAREFGTSGFDGGAVGGDEIPDAPIIFSKATTSVIGPGDAIPSANDPFNSVDYEGELAIVIGTGGRAIAPEAALGHVFGYTIVNDVTSRDAQKKHQQWLLGKGIDGFCPMGPALVTADEMPDLSVVRLTTIVNGEQRQNALLADLIFDVPTLIATISRYITLSPGDIIATGTPAGVGLGFKPPKFLKPGDRVAVRIDPIGTLENPVS
jgi:2-keto-4-pentenoate hydratase/2-oxohepta-3-ene-1,7-dioic acid hydratase in catechol pathway